MDRFRSLGWLLLVVLLLGCDSSSHQSALAVKLDDALATLGRRFKDGDDATRKRIQVLLENQSVDGIAKQVAALKKRAESAEKKRMGKEKEAEQLRKQVKALEAGLAGHTDELKRAREEHIQLTKKMANATDRLRSETKKLEEDKAESELAAGKVKALLEALNREILEVKKLDNPALEDWLTERADSIGRYLNSSATSDLLRASIGLALETVTFTSDAIDKLPVESSRLPSASRKFAFVSAVILSLSVSSFCLVSLFSVRNLMLVNTVTSLVFLMASCLSLIIALTETTVTEAATSAASSSSTNILASQFILLISGVTSGLLLPFLVIKAVVRSKRAQFFIHLGVLYITIFLYTSYLLPYPLYRQPLDAFFLRGMAVLCVVALTMTVLSAGGLSQRDPSNDTSKRNE